MIRSVTSCLAATALLATSLAAAAQTAPAASTEGASQAAPAAPNLSLSAGERTNVRLSYAFSAGNGGDALTSAAELRQTFDEVLSRIAAMTPGDKDYFDAVRQATRAGYIYAWGLYDDQQVAEGDKTSDRFYALLKPYDTDKPPAALAYPLAQYHWLKSRRLSDAGDFDGSSRESDRVFALTRDLDVYPGDYVPLAQLQYRTLWDRTTDKDYSARHAQACALAQSINEVRSDEDTVELLAACDLDHAGSATLANRLDDAQTAIDSARKRLTDLINHPIGQVSIGFKLRLVDVELAAESLAVTRKDDVERVRRQLAAANSLIDTLKDQAYAQTSTNQIGSFYQEIKDTDLSVLPEYADKAKRDAAYLDLYSRLAAAVERSRTAYPKSVSFGVVAAESLARVAMLKLAAGDLAGADAASAKAEDVINQAGLIAQLHTVTEGADSECLVHDRRIQVLIARDRPQEALAAFRTFDATCGDFVRRYPWEFYGRQYAVNTTRRLGTYLHHRRQYADALPLLLYASSWGYDDASFYLADMYRMGHGVAADPARSEAFQDLARKQSLKVFSVATDFGSIRFPFTVYVEQYGEGPRCVAQAAALDPARHCAGFDGIDDQVVWVKELRGGIVLPDAVALYRKLDKAAQDRGVSFPEFAVASLNGAPDQAKVRPADAPPGPPPKSAAPPIVTRTALAAVQEAAKDKALIWPTRVVPFAPGKACFAWLVNVTPEFRTIDVRETYQMPAAKPGRADPNHPASVSADGKQVTAHLDLSLENGVLSHALCPEKTDPLGVYHLQIFAGEKSLLSVEFELVPPADTAPPKSAGPL